MGLASYLSFVFSHPGIRSVPVVTVLGRCLSSLCWVSSCRLGVGSVPVVTVLGQCLSSGVSSAPFPWLLSQYLVDAFRPVFVPV